MDVGMRQWHYVRKSVLIVMLVVISLGCMSGCQAWKIPSGVSSNGSPDIPSVITQVKYRMALLPTLGVVAASLSVLCIGLGATKLGIAALGASVFGTWMSLTLASFSNVFAIVGLVGASILALAMVIKVRKTNTSLVSGVQALKNLFPKEKVNEVVSQYQDSDVAKEVKRIKRKLK